MARGARMLPGARLRQARVCSTATVDARLAEKSLGGLSPYLVLRRRPRSGRGAILARLEAIERGLHRCERVPRIWEPGVDRYLPEHFADLRFGCALPPGGLDVDAQLQLLAEGGKHRDRAQRPGLRVQTIAGVDLAIDEVDDVSMQLRVELLEVVAPPLDALGADEASPRCFNRRTVPSIGTARTPVARRASRIVTPPSLATNANTSRSSSCNEPKTDGSPAVLSVDDPRGMCSEVSSEADTPFQTASANHRRGLSGGWAILSSRGMGQRPIGPTMCGKGPSITKPDRRS